MALCGHSGSINFEDPATWVASTLHIQPTSENAHEEMMSQVRTQTIHSSNKCKIQIKPIQFGWDKFLPTLEGSFPEILSEVLSHNS